MPAKHDSKRAKIDALLEHGTFNPSPERVCDPKFQAGGFFDPRDVVQVKYEMLRRVSVEHASVTDVSDEYGVSRPTFYQAKADFDAAGIAGLVPRDRVRAAPTRSRATSWRSWRRRSSRASRFALASWRGWSTANSASRFIRGRSSAQ